MRGALTFLREDLPRAFTSVDDLHLLGDLADAQTDASQAIAGYVEYLRGELAPHARGSFRSGLDKFEQKLKLEEGLSIGVDRLLAIATARTALDAGGIQAGRRPHRRRRPLAAWSRAKARHPAAGELVAAGRQQIEELATFLERQAVVTLPAGEPITVAPTPDFYRWSFASMWTPGPFESEADGRLLLPHRRRPLVAAGTAGRAPARLQLPDALVDLDPRGVPGSLPALPAPAADRVEDAQVDHVRAGVVRRRVGALLRADDDRSGFRAAGPERPARTARRSAHPPGALHRRHQAAHRGHVGRAGGAVLPRRSVPRGEQRAARGRARHVRSDVSRCTRPAS